MEMLPLDSEIVWRPGEKTIAQSNLKRFMDRHGIASLEALQRKSVSDIAWFWDAVIRELDIRFHRPYEKVVDLSRGDAFAQWCVGGQMNIVHNCLDRYEGTATDERIALRGEGEDTQVRMLTYGQLRRRVNRLAGALRGLGLGRGDAIGLFMPMIPEAVIAMLAIIKIGGIFLPLFSGFGFPAVVSRLRDAQAKALFTVDVTYRRGQMVEVKPIADEAAEQVESLKHLIVCRRTSMNVAWKEGRDHKWDELINSQSDKVATEITGAEDPMMILYTSGTTGKPKGAVHTHCGFPIKAAQDMLHGLDLHADEVVYWVTDMGWMMGPWLVFGTLLNRATMLIYEGALDHPGHDRIWAMVHRHGVTTLGVSPTLVRMLMRSGRELVERHDLSCLRKFGSTGEPWNPLPWRWLFDVVGKSQRPIINYSGGTEVSGGILMGNVLTPLKPCSFSGPVPGMAADVVDEAGRSVRGQVGELVVRRPWIGMTRGFWRDPERYLETYWSRIPGMWVHGDWAMVDGDGLWYILGRSDDTIKIAGKRLGPAEIESILVSHPAVTEAAAIGVPDPLKGQALVCFCVLRPGHEPQGALRAELHTKIAEELGRAMAPKDVKFVRDLPKTRNAKIMRRVIRAAWLGEDPGDVSSLENPASVQAIREAV